MRRFALLFVLAVAACSESHTPAGSDGSAPPDSLTACEASSDCVVIPRSCCGQCGAATRDDGFAVNRFQAAAYGDMACAGGGGCPACAAPQDPTLAATCRAGRCEMVDITMQPLTECTEDSQCTLRSRDCCECGGDVSPSGLIAIRADAEAAYMTLVCDDGPSTGCPECEPIYPVGPIAACSGSGHCQVLRPR
jgi:hypothetical protein